jgi:hypothetical protein
VVFNDTVDIISASNLIVLLKVGFALKLLNFKIRLRCLLPNTADFLKLDFNLKLLSRIICQFDNLLCIVVKAKVEHFLKRELIRVLIELFLYLKLKFLPMSLTHSLITKINNEWHSSSELINLIFHVLKDSPLADFLIKVFNLLLEFDSAIIHIVHSEL